MATQHGRPFRLIGVIHLLPLPGAPCGSPGLDVVINRAVEDARALFDGGIDTAVLENFGDLPFTAGRVDPHVPAMMTRIATRVQQGVDGRLQLGINVLRNDARAALAVACACGAEFIRVNVHIGAAWTDQGLVQGRAHQTIRYRRELGADVRIAADVLVKHAVPAGTMDITETTKETVHRGLADVVIVTGAATGAPTDLDAVRRAKAASAGAPVWVGSGVTPERLRGVMGVADGAIVGTWLHQDGQLAQPLDVHRVRRLVSLM
ncbi:MAG: BtpA/SgcQ family protein [Myxococcota bacterium]